MGGGDPGPTAPADIAAIADAVAADLQELCKQTAAEGWMNHSMKVVVRANSHEALLFVRH